MPWLMRQQQWPPATTAATSAGRPFSQNVTCTSPPINYPRPPPPPSPNVQIPLKEVTAFVVLFEGFRLMDG